MTSKFIRKLTALKAAVIAADAPAALACLDDLHRIARRGISDADRAEAAAALARIRHLAEASDRAARAAIEDVRAILHAARSLQTYDSSGQRQATPTASPVPHRF